MFLKRDDGTLHRVTGLSGDCLAQALQQAIARTHMEQTTFTLGTRWDFHRNMALKAQVDFVRGSSDSLFLYPISNEAFDGKLNVYSVSLDFVF